MKNVLILILFMNIFLRVNSQKLYKDKTSCLNAITEKGYTYKKQNDNQNTYWYRRFDSYGESLVQLTFEGNTLRKAVIGHLDSKQTLLRLKDVYAKTTNAEADTFDSLNGESSNTPYYSGRARFECINDYEEKNYLFVIIPLD